MGRLRKLNDRFRRNPSSIAYSYKFYSLPEEKKEAIIDLIKNTDQFNTEDHRRGTVEYENEEFVWYIDYRTPLPWIWSLSKRTLLIDYASDVVFP